MAENNVIYTCTICTKDFRTKDDEELVDFRLKMANDEKTWQPICPPCVKLEKELLPEVVH